MQKINSDYEIGKIYANKGLALIEDPIHKFLKDCYITVKDKLDFHLAHFHIPGKINAEQQENIQ